MRLLPSVPFVAGLAIAGATLAGQTQTPPPQRAVEAEGTSVTAIVVDVVVRDRDGNPVQGLRQEDFEIQEDGVPQTIGSMTAVAKPAVAPAAEAPLPGPGEPVGEAAKKAPEVLALVFDRLSTESRALAHSAALQYVGDGKVAANVIAVFGIDLSLIFYQPFTRDADAIRAGIESAGGRSTSTFGSTREAQQRATEQMIRSGDALNTMTANAGPGGAPQGIGGAAADAQFAQMQRRMLDSFQALERDEQGYSTSNALMAVVSAMRAIPGRKSVVFFTEGLAIPPNVQARFQSVIDAANRANVSIYPMDAAGLRTLSTTKETQDGVAEASQIALARNPTRDVDRPMMAALERNEDLLRADPHSGLNRLADQTGGFLIANTNDLRAGFSRIDTDMRNYYVLTYVPSNTAFDGRFRTIDVKVKRSDVRVSSRKGYFAVRAPAGAPVLGYEAPALAILDRTPVPNAFPARAAALRFPESDRPGLTPVVVTLPTSGVTFQEVPDRRLYTSDFIVLVRFTDGAGTVFDKMSQRYQLQGPIDQLERAKFGEVVFYREPILGPGVYTMETVVHDALSGKATVRFNTVDVPETDASALRVSSLVAVRRAEKVPEAERIPGSPLYVGDQLLTPNLGEPLSKAAAQELPFYFIVYPGAGQGETSATLAILSSGTLLAEAPLQLAAPDARGRITQVSRIPLGSLPPGTYELRVSVKQGSRAAVQGLTFRLTS